MEGLASVEVYYGENHKGSADPLNGRKPVMVKNIIEYDGGYRKEKLTDDGDDGFNILQTMVIKQDCTAPGSESDDEEDEPVQVRGKGKLIKSPCEQDINKHDQRCESVTIKGGCLEIIFIQDHLAEDRGASEREGRQK